MHGLTSSSCRRTDYGHGNHWIDRVTVFAILVSFVGVGILICITVLLFVEDDVELAGTSHATNAWTSVALATASTFGVASVVAILIFVLVTLVIIIAENILLLARVANVLVEVLDLLNEEELVLLS